LKKSNLLLIVERLTREHQDRVAIERRLDFFKSLPIDTSAQIYAGHAPDEERMQRFHSDRHQARAPEVAVERIARGGYKENTQSRHIHLRK
jgi:hypothetical protein